MIFYTLKAMNKLLICDKSGNKIGLQTRQNVHTKGFWHKGIQLNIYYRGKLLMQKRSVECDIAWNLYDQSLATQMIESDDEDEQKTLKRGLLDELGLDLSLLPKPQKVAGPYKIKKTYKYAPELRNNEFVTLYKIDLDKMIKFKINRHKIDLTEWVDIENVKKDVNSNPNKYTKTFLFWIKKGYI
jgi:isopentenyldiphosphate isomerase